MAKTVMVVDDKKRLVSLVESYLIQSKKVIVWSQLLTAETRWMLHFAKNRSLLF